MKFEAEYIVGVKDIEKNNKMTNFAFLSFLEEIASTHSAKVGYGVNDIENKKSVWLIMDWKLKVYKRPKYGDKLKLKTWARPIDKRTFYTYRDFEVFLGEEKVAIATSKWVLFDLNLNKITQLTEEILSLYNPENEQVFEETELKRLKEQDSLDLELEYKVKRADIDVNNHVHNLNYLTLAYETLPEEEYLKEEKENVRIMYKHQILLGDEIRCYYTKIYEKDIVEIKSKDDKVLHAIIEMYN